MNKNKYKIRNRNHVQIIEFMKFLPDYKNLII